MAYWCGEQLVVTLDGPGGRRTIELAQPFARVGSHPEADVVIADDAVELRAVYLHATPAGVFCLYLDIETQDLEQKGTWLRPDEQIAIGPYWLSARLGDSKSRTELPVVSPAAAGTAPVPLPVLLVYCGSKLKDKRRLRSQLSPLGRRPQCSLQLRGEKVSGFHCVLFWDRGELWFVDLNSSNGTQLNGENQAAGRVQIGDRLEVGDFGLVFQRLSSGGGPPPASPSPAAQQVVPTAPVAPPDDATLPAAVVLPAGPSPAELARDAEYRRLHEEMEREVARLASERQEMHDQWQQSSKQLVAQIGQLHDEAARLSTERQALEQSRHEWQSERAALAEQLAERSNQLARLEADLAAATSTLAEKLAQVEARSASLPPPSRDGEPVPVPVHIDQPERAIVSPAPTAATTDSARATEDVLPPGEALSVPEDWLTGERDTAPANAPVDAGVDGSTLAITPPMVASAASETSAQPAPATIATEPWSSPPAPVVAARPLVSERDQLPQFVSDRLVNLDHEQRRQQLIWWSAGGVGVVALIALAVTIWMWMF